LRRYPKLIGGFTKSCAAKGTEFYTSVLDFDERPELSKPNGVWNLGLCEAAEFAKLAETTYRDVNIGLANQFAKFADKNELDVFKIIEACNSQPYSHIHQPGIAVGGHCIPIYSQFYLWNDPTAQIVGAAREVNQGMPSYGVELLEKKHGHLSGQRVAVLGATYRGGVKDTSFSGVFAIVAALQEKNAIVFVHDPMFSSDELESLGFNPYTLGQSIDAAIIQADHKEYENLNRKRIGDARTVLDGRNLALTNLETEVISIGNITRIHDSIKFTD
jgi:nucleotide sugar dehydrogenase